MVKEEIIINNDDYERFVKKEMDEIILATTNLCMKVNKYFYAFTQEKNIQKRIKLEKKIKAAENRMLLMLFKLRFTRTKYNVLRMFHPEAMQILLSTKRLSNEIKYKSMKGKNKCQKD